MIKGIIYLPVFERNRRLNRMEASLFSFLSSTDGLLAHQGNNQLENVKYRDIRCITQIPYDSCV